MSGQDKRKPINTSAQDPIVPLAEGLAAHIVTGDASNAIPIQEALGQQSFVNSDTLPTRTNDYGDYNSQRVLEAAGVKFGDLVEGDPLFQCVELPAGWKKVPTDHHMWSSLVDEKGREHASIFYKAAFYDRDAFYTVTSRYRVSVDYGRQEKEGVTVAQVMDGNVVTYTTDPVKGEGLKSHELSRKAVDLAIQWLNERFPDWRNPAAYWE